jgi:hypothetical protein
VPPPPASAVDEATLELLDDSLLLDEDDPDEDLSPDEQPARPATTIAVPPMATSKLCFTTVLLIVPCDPSRSADRRTQYGAPIVCDVGFREKPCRFPSASNLSRRIATILESR